MGERVVVAPEFRGRIPADWASFEAAEGVKVAASSTTSTIRTRIRGIPVFLKRHRYPIGVSLRAALRHTFVRPSRPGREFRMLGAFRERAGPDVAPSPVALGERRVFGFLREAFVASEELPDARPVTPADLTAPGAAEALGTFLARLREAGLLHGRLFARNLLRLPDGTFRVVDLDRSRVCRFCREGHGIPAYIRSWAADLARLLESLGDLPRGAEGALLAAFDAQGEGATDEWAKAIGRYREAARRQLDRRATGRGR